MVGFGKRDWGVRKSEVGFLFLFYISLNCFFEKEERLEEDKIEKRGLEMCCVVVKMDFYLFV